MSDAGFFFTFFAVLVLFALTAGRGDGIFTDYLSATSTVASRGSVSEAGPTTSGLQPIPLKNTPSSAPVPLSFIARESSQDECLALFGRDPHFTERDAWEKCLEVVTQKGEERELIELLGAGS